MEVHEYATLFPLCDKEDFAKLVASIKADGLRDPITLYEGKILDGRNRFNACTEAGVTPTFEEYTGKDPLQFVIDKNLPRRNLNTSQRAMVAARLATLTRGWRHPHGTARIL